MRTLTSSRVGSRHISRPRPPADRTQRRTAVAARRLPRPSLHRRRPGPFAAHAPGEIERLSKGVYYRTRETAFGKSRPNPAAIRKLASRRKTVFPIRHCRRQSPGIHDAERQARRGCHQRPKPAPQTHRQRHGHPHTPAGGMGESLRDRCGAARFPATRGQDE